MSREDVRQNENEIQNFANQAAMQKSEITEDELIDAVAANVLERVRPAFEELAR